MMNNIQELDRTLVAIFDIEGFSKSNPEDQAHAVATFVENLDNILQELNHLVPDAFSTGDGAIISIGRQCKIDKTSTRLFIEFVKNFVLGMLQSGLILRTAVNYSERDRVLIIKDLNSLQGNYVQIGDTINTAARIIAFCEPGEIMINKSVHDLLRGVSLEKEYRFFENDIVRTKHNQDLHTFTYIPPEEEKAFLYSPDSAMHQYKRYNYFPPISGEIVKYLMENGLDFELKKVISNAFESIDHINYTRNMISWNNVINVLIQLTYDPTDTMYVLNRLDRPTNFWTQPRRQIYTEYLKNHAEKHGGYINQTRFRIYDYSKRFEGMKEDDIHNDLIELHNTNTYFSLPSNWLFRYERLNELIFGVTVSKRHKYAIIPIPSQESMDVTFPGLDNIGKALIQYKDYDSSHGPMKAVISANTRYVNELIKEFEELLKEPQLGKIK